MGEFKKKIKISKGVIRNRKSKRIDDTRVKNKRTKGQTTIYQLPHKKLNIEQHDLHLKELKVQEPSIKNILAHTTDVLKKLLVYREHPLFFVGSV